MRWATASGMHSSTFIWTLQALGGLAETFIIYFIWPILDKSCPFLESQDQILVVFRYKKASAPLYRQGNKVRRARDLQVSAVGTLNTSLASTAGGLEAGSVRSYRTRGIMESPPSSVLDALELPVLSWVNSAAPRVAGGMRGGNGNSTHPHMWTQDTVPAKPSAHWCTQRMPRSVLLRSSLHRRILFQRLVLLK